MPGETDLNAMLRGMSPSLDEAEYVFCSFPSGHYGDYSNLNPLACFAEAEGLTLVLPRASADENGQSYEAVFRRITLLVHSSLEAVGLTAAVSQQLARVDISANMIAGYYHDHLFVPVADADKALQSLQALAVNSQG